MRGIMFNLRVLTNTQLYWFKSYLNRILFHNASFNKSFFNEGLARKENLSIMNCRGVCKYIQGNTDGENFLLNTVFFQELFFMKNPLMQQIHM